MVQLFSETSQLIKKINGKDSDHQTSDDFNSKEHENKPVGDTVNRNSCLGFWLSILFVLFNGTNFVLTQVRRYFC